MTGFIRSLVRMTSHRVKKVLAWVLALIIIGLLGFGVYYLAVVV